MSAFIRRSSMSSKIDTKLGRRGFLKGMAAATGAVPLPQRLPIAVGVTGVAAVAQSGTARAEESANAAGTSNLPAPEGGYQSLGPDEAGFIEALVNIMCPADALTPSGVDCGLATTRLRDLPGHRALPPQPFGLLDPQHRAMPFCLSAP
jgi:hypothetical protein